MHLCIYPIGCELPLPIFIPLYISSLTHRTRSPGALSVPFSVPRSMKVFIHPPRPNSAPRALGGCEDPSYSKIPNDSWPSENYKFGFIIFQNRVEIIKLVSFFQKKSELVRGLHGRNSPLDKTNDIWQPLSLLRGEKLQKAG